MLLLLLVSCAGEQGQRTLGIIDYADFGTEAVLNAPDFAKTGQDFQVAVATFAGACDRVGDTEVKITGMTATITVYDIVGITSGCTADIQRFEHPVTLRFEQAGTATIRVEGRRVGQDTPNEGQPRTLSHSIVVQ